jgi:hypothetical protein
MTFAMRWQGRLPGWSGGEARLRPVEGAGSAGAPVDAVGAISGAQGDRMTRDEAWRLVFIGRHIERLGTLALFLEVAERSGALDSRSGFDLLLHLFDSTLTYRSLFQGAPMCQRWSTCWCWSRPIRAASMACWTAARKARATAHRRHWPGACAAGELLPPASALPSRTLLCASDR